MPIYGYACRECGHTLDALQKMSDEPLVDCPDCGRPALERQLSAPRFRLKGQGWYETDFKSDKKRNLAGDAEPAKAESKDGAPKADGATDKPAKDESAKAKPAKDSATGGGKKAKSSAGDPAGTA